MIIDPGVSELSNEDRLLRSPERASRIVENKGDIGETPPPPGSPGALLQTPTKTRPSGGGFRSSTQASSLSRRSQDRTWEVKNTFIHYGSPISSKTLLATPNTVPPGFAPKDGFLFDDDADKPPATPFSPLDDEFGSGHLFDGVPMPAVLPLPPALPMQESMASTMAQQQQQFQLHALQQHLLHQVHLQQLSLIQQAAALVPIAMAHATQEATSRSSSSAIAFTPTGEAIGTGTLLRLADFLPVTHPEEDASVAAAAAAAVAALVDEGDQCCHPPSYDKPWPHTKPTQGPEHSQQPSHEPSQQHSVQSVGSSPSTQCATPSPVKQSSSPQPVLSASPWAAAAALAASEAAASAQGKGQRWNLDPEDVRREVQEALARAEAADALAASGRRVAAILESPSHSKVVADEEVTRSHGEDVGDTSADGPVGSGCKPGSRRGGSLTATSWADSSPNGGGSSPPKASSAVETPSTTTQEQAWENRAYRSKAGSRRRGAGGRRAWGEDWGVRP